MGKALVVLLLFISPVHAGFFDKKLQQYICPSHADALNCSSECEKYNGGFIEFKVDKNHSFVSFTVYDNKKIAAQGVDEDCKIIDEKNWNCSTDSSPQMLSVSQMVNGVYSVMLHYRKPNSKVMQTTYSCAK